MDTTLCEELTRIAKEHSHPDDPSHDFGHINRVLQNVEYITKKEGGDLDILIPAALFHDVINYPKNDPRARQAAQESADWTQSLLKSMSEFPSEKINAVADAIAKCSFTNGNIPDFLEGKILQDADNLESTGAIAIMRTFSASGTMKRAFYLPADPFCEQRDPALIKASLDLFYKRLLKVRDRLHTKTAQQMASHRHKFVLDFLEQLRRELDESKLKPYISP